MVDPLRSLTPQERAEMITSSIFALRIRKIKSPEGLEAFMQEEYFTQDEKDYVLFNLDSLDKISKLALFRFREEVRKFKKND